MLDFMYYNPVRVHFGKDAMSRLPEELEKYGKNILLAYGGGSIKRTGLYDRVMDALKNIPVRMISYGGSNHNISFLVHKEDKVRTMQALSDTLFSM